jgi:4-amino-4-deoxy-L-arabinose transferase-like glycosyltransferase
VLSEPVPCPMPGRRSGVATHVLFLVVALCLFAIRLSLVFLAGSDEETWTAVLMTVDGEGYVWTAGQFAQPIHDQIFYRMPGYPWLMLGAEAFPGPRWMVLIAFQQLLDFLSAVCAGFTLKRFLPGADPWLVASAVLVLPVMVFHSFLLLPDTIVTFACCFSTLLLAHGIQSGSGRKLVLFSALAGAAISSGAMAKPVLIYGWIPLAVFVLLSRDLRFLLRLLAVVVLLAASLSLPSLWRARNLREAGVDAYSAQDGFELTARIGVMGGTIDPSRPHVLKDSLEALYRLPDGSPDFARRDSVFRSLALEGFSHRPLDVVLPHLYSWPMFFKPGTSYFEDVPFLASSRPLFLALKGTAFAISLAAGILFFAAAFSRDWRRRLSGFIRLALCWFVFAAITAGPLADNPRYGLPFMWSFTAVAAVRAEALIRGLAARRGSGGAT